MTADDVAVAIVTASRLMGADPLEVASGGKAVTPKDLSIPRARAYAASALVDTLGINLMTAARVCGSGSPTVYMTVHRRRIALGEVKWWDTEVLAKVCRAICMGRATPAEPKDGPKPEPAHWGAVAASTPVPRLTIEPRGYSSLSIPPQSNSKRGLQEMLREAVENTAKMQPK